MEDMSEEVNRETLENAANESSDQIYVLRLYITGTTPKSVNAISSIKKICEEYLHGRYNLEVVDIYQQPSLAAGEQIIAVPTLIKHLPEPVRRFIGDMQDEQKLLFGMDLVTRTK